MRLLSAVLTGACGAAFALAASAQDGGPPPVPHEQAAFRAEAFHNDIVTVLWMDIPGGKNSDYHVHSRDMTCVVVDDYPPEGHTQPLGGPPNAPRLPKRGEVSYVEYYGKPTVTHRDINPGTLSAHQICAQLNSPTPGGFAPATRDAAYKLELDNPRLRAWRLVLAPGQVAAAITQNAPGMRVVLTGGMVEEIAPGKRDHGLMLRPDHVYWQDAGSTRAVRNIGATTVELIEYEFK